MINSLQTAIVERYNSASGATLRGLTQGIFEDVAPPKTNLEFITFSVIGSSLSQSFDSNVFDVLVQYSLWGQGNMTSSKALLQIGDEFLLLYGDVILSMSQGYDNLRTDTINQLKLKDDDKGFQLIYDFNYQIKKGR